MDDEGILCDYCDKAFHKECLGDSFIERNPISWFCPKCERILASENSKDPYCDHDLLTYLATKELPLDLPAPAVANLEKLASLYKLDE